MVGAGAIGESIGALVGCPHGEASYCLLAPRRYPGAFASGASVDLARGHIGSVAVRGMVGGLQL